MRLLSLMFLCAAAVAAQTGAWTDLFPDAKLSGWTRIAIPPANPLQQPSQWKVDTANRILVCEGNGGHEMLRYDRELADFILRVEWRFTPVADPKARYNSGIFVRNDALGNIWHQAQAGEAGGWIFGLTPANGINQRLNLRPEMKENRVKPAGNWNAYEITCQGRMIRLAVNGGVTSEFDRCEVPKGYMALEAEGYRIEFRNLRLKSLR